MSAKYKSPSFLLPNELNTSANPLNTDGNPATGTGVNSLYSMNFDSANLEHINLGIISEINGLTNFSFSIWMKPIFGSPLEGKMVFGNRDVPNSYHGVALAIGNRANKVSYFYLASATGTIYLNLGADIWTENAWNHFTVTYDGSQIKAYINNGSPITGSISGATLSSTAPFYIGREIYQGSQNFRGQLDEFCIFNKALNDNERAALYDGTGSNIRPSNLMATDLNPIAYYPLGEQAQNTGYLDPNNPGSDISGSEWQFPNGVLQDYVMDFDGSTDYITIPKDSALSLVNTDFSISIWLNPDVSHNSLVIMNYASSKGWGVYYNSGNLRFRAYPSSWQTLTTISTSVWTHILIVCDDAGNNL